MQVKVGELSAYRADREVERNAADDEVTALGEEITAQHIRISELEKDIETAATLRSAIDARLAEQIALRDAAGERIAELRQTLAQTEAAILENRAKAEQGEAKLAELNARRAEVEAGGMEFEKQQNELRVRLREQNNRKNWWFVRIPKMRTSSWVCVPIRISCLPVSGRITS